MSAAVADPPQVDRYRLSRELYGRANRLIPGGVHLSGRPLLTPENSPLYIERGKGCRCWDVDGNEYIDYLMAYGAFLLGYADEQVDAAAAAQIARGNLLSLNHPLHLDFAERLIDRMPGAEMAVFVKTGSEATTAALRIARRYTGRRKVLRCGYHGWHDWCYPDESWVPGGLGEQVIPFDASQPEILSELLKLHAGQVAAVIVAPEMVLAPQRDTFSRLIELTREAGAVFVFDEIKTGLRVAPGSIQQYLGVTPDLTTLSKALGNGWPIAAVVGCRQVMEKSAGLHVSATYHGETGAMAAALATLDRLDAEDVCGHVWRLGEILIDGLNAAAARHRIPARAYGEPLPPMPFLSFANSEPAVSDQLTRTFYTEVLNRGILLHPRHLWFISQAHRPVDIERTLEMADAAFALTAARHPDLLQRW